MWRAFSLFFFVVHAYASVGTGALVTYPVTAAPGERAVTAWIDSHFGESPHWTFREPSALFRDLKRSRVDSGLRAMIDVRGFRYDDWHQAKFDGESNWGVDVEPQQLEAASARDLQIVYRHLLKHEFYPQKRFAAMEAARAYVRAIAREPAEVEPLLRNIVAVDGAFVVLTTHDAWPRLARAHQEQVVRSASATRSVLGVDLVYDDEDDLDAVAATYAMGRDPRAIARVLRHELARNESRPVTLPLKTILPKSIRDEVDTFASEDGPNCLDAALSVVLGRAHTSRRWQTSFETVRASHRYLNPREALRPGDLLVYKDPAVIHASIVIGDDLVFTKNGADRRAPYQFQSRRDNERIYFDAPGARLLALRRTAPGASAANRVGYGLASEVVYRERPADPEAATATTRSITTRTSAPRPHGSIWRRCVDALVSDVRRQWRD